MTTEIDLRGRPADEYRTRLFDAFEGSETGADVEIVAETDVDPHLVRYQHERDRALEWEHEHPDAEPRELEVTVGDALEAIEELDVRDLPPAQRHERIFDAYETLTGGEGFVLVNDHDPEPLYHQFDAEAGPEFRWEYRQREPGEFRVLIGKADADGTESHANEEPATEEPEPEAPF